MEPSAGNSGLTGQCEHAFLRLVLGEMKDHCSMSLEMELPSPRPSSDPHP